ncbi:MAG TPA: hypothetical protein VK435_05110, partial [Thermodesulfovibrionales bacterium]|nr:hypothetical protein [Thermodesulfovibrionales bacterium]
GKFTPEQIEGCISRQLETGENVCLKDGDSERIVNELSKAEVIREMTDDGMSLADALRELARRMRQFQLSSKGE